MAAPPEMRRRMEMAAGPQQMVARDLMEGKILRAVYSNRQLEEVLADFWYNHFNVFLDKGADRYLVTAYERDAIRPHVLGKFKDLLVATAKSPAMLFYLDNWQSVGPDAPQARRAAEEGRARPERELRPRTAGAAHARRGRRLHAEGRDRSGALLHRLDHPAIRSAAASSCSTPRMHDNGEKTVLGVTIPAGGGIERRREGARYRGASPLHRALHLAEAGAALRGRRSAAGAGGPHGGDVPQDRWRPARSDEDHARIEGILVSEGAYRSKMKSPLEMVASAVRAVERRRGLRVPAGQPGGATGPAAVSQAGAHRLFELQHGVGQSGGLLARMNFALQLADNKVPGVKVDPRSRRKPDDPMAGLALGSPEFQKQVEVAS